MNPKNSKATSAGIAVVITLAFLFSILTPAFADVEASTPVDLVLTEHQDVVLINLTQNSTQCKGATFAWYPGTMTIYGSNITFTGLMRIHVNWDVANTDYFLNILEILTTSAVSGSFNLTLNHTAQEANILLGPNETSALTVYMKHGYQSAEDPGYLIENDTAVGPFVLYAPPQVSYYIGFQYVKPPITVNSVGQYLNFSFDFTFSV